MAGSALNRSPPPPHCTVSPPRPSDLRCDEDAFLRMEALAVNFSKRIGHPHGKFGIFAHRYKRVKARFMFMRTCQMWQAGRVTSMCELGLNAGLSALLLLEAAPTATLVSFDLGDLGPRASSTLLAELYPSRFLGVQYGASQQTLPSYLHAHGLTCDLAFVDGDKSFDGRLRDLHNLREFRAPCGMRLFFDEVTALRCLNGSVPPADWTARCAGLNHNAGFRSAAAVYDKLSREGWIRVMECDWPRELRDFDGICMADLSVGGVPSVGRSTDGASNGASSSPAGLMLRMGGHALRLVPGWSPTRWGLWGRA